jgi:hypothetical protein
VTDLRDQLADLEAAARRPESLARWLDFLKTPDCSCPYEWRGIGILYGVSFGKGWVRMSTDPACQHHGGSP